MKVFAPRPPLSIAVVSTPDEYTASLRSGGEVEYFSVDPLNISAQSARLRDADAALLWECPPAALTELFSSAPKLKWCHWKSAGVENLPLELFKQHGITLTNSAGVFAESLAEFVVMGLLYFIKDVPRLRRQQHAREWKTYEVRELRKSRALIVGYGGIGRAIAERLAALQVEVIACRNRTDERDPFLADIIRPASIRAILPTIDHLILSAPLTPETRGMIGEAEFRALKSSAIIANVGRGPLIVESELIAALREQRIQGAALDVFDIEPLPSDSPFWSLDNVIISPHTADRTAQWLWDALRGFREQVARALEQEPLANVVNLERGY